MTLKRKKLYEKYVKSVPCKRNLLLLHNNLPCLQMGMAFGLFLNPTVSAVVVNLF